MGKLTEKEERRLRFLEEDKETFGLTYSEEEELKALNKTKLNSKSTKGGKIKMGKLKFEENDLGWFIREDGVETETTKFETIGIISKHIENPYFILGDDIAMLEMSVMEEIVEFMKKNIQNKQKEVKNK